MPEKKFAAFDIDGTIIRWQLYHAVGDAMARAGMIAAADYGRVRRARMNWKQRSGEDSFHEYEQVLISVFDGALTGLAVNGLKQVVGPVFDTYKDQVYVYTRDLIHDLKQRDYLLFAISGSPSIIVSLFASYYGFDDYAATEYVVRDGHYTGEKILSVGRKAVLLQQLIDKHGASLASSVAVGDSEGDIPMLQMVEQPIAFNPSKGLADHAMAEGWRIVIERKNKAWALERRDGTYLLAQTDD